MSSIGPSFPAHLQRPSEPEAGPTGPFTGPQLPSQVNGPEAQDEEEDYAPSLPPDMIAARSARQEQSSPAVVAAAAPRRAPIGPAMPPGFSSTRYDASEDESDDEVVGPLPPSAYEQRGEQLDGVQQFLEREKRMAKDREVSSLR